MLSNGLDPDLDRTSIDPDLGPNFLQRLSADDKTLIARILFYLIFYLPSTIFHLNRDGSSWVKPVLS